MIQMTTEQSMSAAEFRCLRDRLGLTTAWLAYHFEVAERSVQRWDSGASRVPVDVAAEMHSLAEITDAALDQLIADPPKVLVTYRTDADYRRQAGPLDWPASWHRALCGRAMEEIGVRVKFQEPLDNHRKLRQT